jgi:hypothetical protein
LAHKLGARDMDPEIADGQINPGMIEQDDHCYARTYRAANL